MNAATSTLNSSLTNESDPCARAEKLFDFMRETGQTFYDESVTQLEHALQCANLAVESGANDETVVGALLHDFGHFIQNEHAANEDFLKSDLQHEDVAAEFLAEFLPDAVIEPIRYHVVAKRYLCTVDETYHDQLSSASQHSLSLQGGKLSPEELAEFEKHPHLDGIVQVRRWDDLAKEKGKDCPPLEAYTERVANAWL